MHFTGAWSFSQWKARADWPASLLTAIAEDTNTCDVYAAPRVRGGVEEAGDTLSSKCPLNHHTGTINGVSVPGSRDI